MVRPRLWGRRKNDDDESDDEVVAVPATPAELPFIKRNELSEVFCVDDPQVDIVLVHGLNGHPKDTWTARNGAFWPSQILPKTLHSVRPRILVYGYNADVYAFGGRSATSDFILQHAQTLVTTLDAERFNEDASERPIIFVAHSLGGILVKKALDYSGDITDLKNENLRSIFVSTYGVIFLGTPHNGAEPAKWGKMIQSMCSALLPSKLLDTQPQLVNTLKTQSETLQNINMDFSQIMNRFHIAFFHEAQKTNFGVTQDFVVDQTSAAPIMSGPVYGGIEATHSGMAKFESKNAPGYTIVSSTLKRWGQDAPATIANRWPEEYANRDRARKFQAHELLRSVGGLDALGPPSDHSSVRNASSAKLSAMEQSTSQLSPPGPSTEIEPSKYTAIEPADSSSPIEISNEPLLITPAGFRPNAIFVGMQKELEELDRKLFDVESRSRGTACVLLCCLPGGGKSHLAREYVFTRQHKFPGGIYWVRARSKAEIAQGFWEIAQKAALRDIEDPRNARFEQDTEVFIQTVKNWFRAKQEWLLVFDGITFDSEKDIAGFEAFLPDGKNSSVILTSVDKSLAGRHYLLSPVAVKVSPLEEADARKLLFKEMGNKKPTKAEVEKASELVQKVERLPLAIHAIGRRLKETGEPLMKYHIRTYSSDPRLREPFSEILEDLSRLKHYEARNLINILCFFREHIPFEMVHLGVKSLKGTGVEVRAKDRGARRDLNTTFGVLMRYALVERNDLDDSASRTSHSSFTETIDMLKIHSVIQNFIGETLKSAGQLSSWLLIAVRVFNSSYNDADCRMKNKEGAGLVRDYREYEIHGKRLMEHVRRNQLKYKELDVPRFDLEKVLDKIEEEIRQRTPGSSREAVSGAEAHVSIFDRTSSTSSTGPETPSIISNVSTWGLELDKPPNESPTSMEHSMEHPARPEIVDHSPRSQFPPLYKEDTGYLSELDQPGGSSSMSASMSQLTARPLLPAKETVPADGLNDSQITEEDPAQHRTVIAMQQRRYRDSVSAWRHIEPRSLDPRVSRVTVQRSDIRRPRSNSKIEATGISQAEVALAAFQRGSPPPRGGGSVGRRAPSQTREPALPTPSEPTSYADAVSVRLEDDSELLPSSLPETIARRPEAMRRDISGQSLPEGRPYDRYLPFPDAAPSRIVYRDDPSQLLGAPLAISLDSPPLDGSPHSSPGLGYSHPLQSSDPMLQSLATRYIKNSDLYRITGRNPAPIPFEDISNISSQPLLSPNRINILPHHVPHASITSSMRNAPPTSEYTLASGNDVFIRPQFPTGYTSEPMSRAHSSQQSHASAATHPASATGTEPARYPPAFSTSPPSASFRPTALYTLAPTRPRDSSPLSHHQEQQTPRFTPSHTDNDFSAMGGWVPAASHPFAAPAALLPDENLPPSPPPPTSLSRGSSQSSNHSTTSGPGIAALGTFVRFGDRPPTSNSSTSPDLLGERLARLRAATRRERLERAIELGAFRPPVEARRPVAIRRPLPVPYPVEEGARVAMPEGGEMVVLDGQGRVGGRSRGRSSPERVGGGGGYR